MNLAHVSEFRYSDSRHTRHTQITFWLLSLKFSTCSVYIYTHFYYYFKRRASFRALWLFQRFIYQFYFRVLSYLWILVIFVSFFFVCDFLFSLFNLPFSLFRNELAIETGSLVQLARVSLSNSVAPSQPQRSAQQSESACERCRLRPNAVHIRLRDWHTPQETSCWTLICAPGFALPITSIVNVPSCLRR